MFSELKLKEIERFRREKLPDYSKIASEEWYKCDVCGERKPFSEMWRRKYRKVCKDCAFKGGYIDK